MANAKFFRKWISLKALSTFLSKSKEGLLAIYPLPQEFSQMLAADGNMVVLHCAGDVHEATTVARNKERSFCLANIGHFVPDHSRGDGRMLNREGSTEPTAFMFPP